MKSPHIILPQALTRAILLVLVLSVCAPILIIKISDVDIWWHLQLGLTALETGSPPDLENFYFSRVIDSPSVYRYTLLGDMVFAVVHKMTGDIGLQIFALGLIGLSAWLIWTIGRPKGVYLALAILAFVATTYQLQILRNALFSMVMFCLLLRLWHAARFQKKNHLWWWIAPVLTLWSFLHGSFMVGFGILSLIALGEGFDALKKGDLAALPWRQYAQQILLSLLGIAFFNKLTFQLAHQFVRSILAWGLLAVLASAIAAAIVLVRKGWRLDTTLQHRLYPFAVAGLCLGSISALGFHFSRYFGKDLTMAGINLLDPGSVTTTVTLGFFGRLKFGLNNLLWKTASADYLSSDFLSPFEGLGEIYIWSTLILCLLTLALCLANRRFAWTWFLPFAATLIFALGYKRMVGYCAIFCIFTLLRLSFEKSLKIPLSKPLAWAALLAFSLFFWGGFGLKKWDPGLRNYHYMGFGRSPIFSTKTSAWVKDRYLEAPVFTTVNNGGFLLKDWYPDKKVFIDGFFAPHRGTPLKAYQSVLFGSDPDELVRRLGLKLAVVNLFDIKWFLLFNRAPNWYPEALDEGMVLFTYQPNFKDSAPPLDLLLDIKTIAKLPASYRRMVANRLFQLQTGYLLKGRIEAANGFALQHAALLEALPAFADDRIREERDHNMLMAKQNFGDKDTLWLREEYRYQDALAQGNQEEVRAVGGRIFDANPRRFEMALVLASAALNGAHIAETKRYLLALGRSQGEDPAFFSRHKSTIAEFYYRAMRIYRDHAKHMDAFDMLKEANRLAPKRFNSDVFFNDSLGLYELLLAEGEPVLAYQLLVNLELRDPENPFIQHLLSVTIRNHHQELSLPMSSALRYAEKAMKLAENQPEAPMEAFRENMALILESMGRDEEAKPYRTP